MKITKTTLLFIATLFFLALPLMFVSGNAQAAAYNDDGSVHSAITHGWQMPTDNGTCIGADANTPVDGNAQSLGKQGPRENCGSVQPAWVGTDFPTQAACTAAGYAWKGTCTGATGYFHYAAECTAAGGTWTPKPDGAGNCENMWYNDTSAEYEAGTGAYECLYCHDGGHGYNMGDYLKGGHKNMSRKADGIPWTTSIEYGSADLPGYDWTTAGSVNGVTSPSTLSDGTTPVFWIYDGWLSATPRAVTSGSSYNCGRCHTTGWTADATLNTTKEPEASFPGINTIVNLSAADDSGTMQPYSSWDHFGILCSRCHNAVGGHANSGPAADDMDTALPAGGPSQAAKCYNCHRQVDGKNLPLNAQTLLIGEQLTIKAGHGGALGITSHANGYLNSPHARFSGTYGQLADSTQYDSHFITGEGTCAACHNVHDSLTDTNVGAKPWNKECGLDCHSQSPTDPYGKPLSGIQHPSGPGTPLANATVDDPVSACETCHMPGGLHLFRINPDPTYSTYAAGAGGYVTTIPDASHNNFPSAYIDIDMACGQCHGGNEGSGATKNGAPYMTVNQLAPFAETMHGGAVTTTGGALFSWTVDTSKDNTINFAVNGAACTEGGCTYSWDFGDSKTDTGPTVSHTYASSGPETVTLTVSNGGTNTQVVTPAAAHVAPQDCSTSSVTMTGKVGDLITYTDKTNTGSKKGTDKSPAVYVNWGDGSPMSTGAVGGDFTHTYIWDGNYEVTEIVQDNMGFSCVNKVRYVTINSAGTTATDIMTINADAATWTTDAECTAYEVPAPCCTGLGTGNCTTTSKSLITFYVTGVNANNVPVSIPGTVALGGSTPVKNLDAGTNYTVTFYYPTGHTCDNTSDTVASNGTDTVTGCK